MLRIVIDTNIWIRVLLGGKVSSPVLVALRDNRFKAIISNALLEELREVSQRSRLRKRIDPIDRNDLLELLEWYGESVELNTIPPVAVTRKTILSWQQPLTGKPMPS
jgi:putative PIN family toxin of toxin-antitoxin system